MNQDALAEVDDFTFLPGTVSLVEEVDHRILVVLQDGRKLLGVLRSFDQYGMLAPNSIGHCQFVPHVQWTTAANLVLEQTIERIYVGEQYAEKNLGLFLVRGDNIVLLGPIVLPTPPPPKRVHASNVKRGGGE
jgi:U6 snRNA-associated Sm-like protein LSm1